MDENNVNSAEPMTTEIENKKSLPAEINAWTKIKNFLFKEITIELTPKQQKVFKEVYDFWHIEITKKDFHDFLFHEITWQSTKDFWLQKIDITL